MLICYRNRKQEPSGPAEMFNNFYDILLKCLLVSNSHGLCPADLEIGYPPDHFSSYSMMLYSVFQLIKARILMTHRAQPVKARLNNP